MARFNEILVGRINRGLQKMLSMKGEAPAPQLGSEITPVLPLPLGNEHRFLDGWNRYGVHINVAGVAAQNGIMRIGIPVNSNVIAVIERWTFWFPLVATFSSCTLTNGVTGYASLATVPTAGTLDGRNAPAAATTIVSFATGVAPLGIAFLRLQSAQTYAEAIRGPDDELVITPGHFYDLSCDNVNQQFAASVIWRERFLEDSERS